MKAFCLLILFAGAVALLRADSLPEELLSAKEAYEQKVESISSDPALEKLNEKYSASLGAAKQQAQNAGKLELLIELSRELDSITSTGKPSDEPAAERGDLAKLRAIYVSEKARIERTLQPAVQAAAVEYEKKLAEMVKEFTKAGRIEDAIATQKEAAAIAESKPAILPASPSAGKPVAVKPQVQRAGRLRGFGRTSGFMPEGAEIDLSKFDRYDDIVDISGGMREFLVLRENGDVLNHKAETVGKGAERIIPFGYMDKKGIFHTTSGLHPPEAAQPMRALDLLQNHGLAVHADGTLHGWKDDYETGKRTIPDFAKNDIVQVACHWDGDYALNSKGEFFRWNKDGPGNLSSEISRGVKYISITEFHTAFVITEDNDLVDLDGKKPDLWKKKAKNVLTGGTLWAVLDMDDRWHTFVQDEKEAIGNEPEILDAVLNRSETIDVVFYQYPSRDPKWLGNYVFWIEETGGPEFDFRDPDALKNAVAAKNRPGEGFFGVPFD